MLGIEKKEVIICRFLADLLNPWGAHGKGDLYLRSFINNVLSDSTYKVNWSEDNYKNTRVETEHYINDNLRRIDIVISSDTRFIPIEVKIDACDREGQCYSYWEYADKRNQEETYLWYLTKYGSMPSEDSICNSNGKNLLTDRIKCISFKHDIYPWIKTIYEEEKRRDFKKILFYYMDAIDRFTGGIDMNIGKKLNENADTYRAATILESGIIEAKQILIKNFLKDLEKAIDAELQYLHKENDWQYMNYETCVEKYGKQSFADSRNNKALWPGINYNLNINLKNSISLFVRIEVYKKLWYGIVAFKCDNNKNELTPVEGEDAENMWKDNHLEAVFGKEKPEKPNWNISYYEEIVSPPRNSVPDFKEMNDAAIDLIGKDSESRKVYIKTIIADIRRNFSEQYLIQISNKVNSASIVS